jgi:hypothetical protein
MLSKSFEQMLSATGSYSQELHHSAERDFSHNFQYVMSAFYLISSLDAAFMLAI